MLIKVNADHLFTPFNSIDFSNYGIFITEEDKLIYETHNFDQKHQCEMIEYEDIEAFKNNSRYTMWIDWTRV